MKQIITLNFGQAGINISDSTLSLYLKEHGMNEDFPLPIKTSVSQCKSETLVDKRYNKTFFQQCNNNNFVYRSISVDCDPYSSDQLLAGKNSKYYKKNRIISSKQSTGGAFSRAFWIMQNQMVEKLEEQLQKTLQTCDNLQGVILNMAMLGGASGLFMNSTHRIFGQNYLHKKITLANVLFPSKCYGNSVLEYYNYTLAFTGLLQHITMVIPFDNQTLYEQCQNIGIENPGFSQLNSLISKVQSSLTLSLRSQGPLNSDLSEMATNLVCYPRIKLLYPSYTPFVSWNKRYSNRLSNADQLTNDILDPKSRMLNMHGIDNKIAVGLFYRGDITPYEVRESLKKVRHDKNSNCIFEDWSPLGFKVGINHEESLPLTSHDSRMEFQNELLNEASYIPSRSCCSLTSSMQFHDLLGYNNHKFDILYAKRAFMFHYVSQGLQEGDLSWSREDLAALQKDYERFGCEVSEQQQNDDDQN